MSKLSTSGNSSCAVIAVQGFKIGDKELNVNYMDDPSTFDVRDDMMDVQSFYTDILYPTKQELGRTQDYPFELLMETIMDSHMASKLKTVVLNSQQNMGYWPEQLEKWGFVLVDKTHNSIGSMNYLYIQNPNRPDDMYGVTQIPGTIKGEGEPYHEGRTLDYDCPHCQDEGCMECMEDFDEDIFCDDYDEEGAPF